MRPLPAAAMTAIRKIDKPLRVDCGHLNI